VDSDYSISWAISSPTCNTLTIEDESEWSPMEQQRKYEQLSQADRTLIAWMLQRCPGVRVIAREIECSPGTISRELRCNNCPMCGYAAQPVHTAEPGTTQRCPARSEADEPHVAAVCHTDHAELAMVAAPAGQLDTQADENPDNASQRVSHETYLPIFVRPPRR